MERVTSFDLPKGYVLLQVKEKLAEGFYIVMAKRLRDGELVTWEYNEQSKCYHGHYYTYDQLQEAEADFMERCEC